VASTEKCRRDLLASKKIKKIFFYNLKIPKIYHHLIENIINQQMLIFKNKTYHQIETTCLKPHPLNK
jgi:hypothetical protein